jgi:hypothetical protein
MTPCSVAIEDQRFGGSCCLHCPRLYFTLKKEAAKSSETLVSYRNTTCRQESEDLESIFTTVKTLEKEYLTHCEKELM